MSVLLFGFDLVVERRAEVLQTFGVLAFVQHHLIYNNQELGGPVLIELAAEVFVGVERDIILKDGFQEVEEMWIYPCCVLVKRAEESGASGADGYRAVGYSPSPVRIAPQRYDV